MKLRGFSRLKQVKKSIMSKVVSSKNKQFKKQTGVKNSVISKKK